MLGARWQVTDGNQVTEPRNSLVTTHHFLLSGWIMVVGPSQPTLSPPQLSTVHCLFGEPRSLLSPVSQSSGITVVPHLAQEAPHGLRHRLTARLPEVTPCCQYMVRRLWDPDLCHSSLGCPVSCQSFPRTFPWNLASSQVPCSGLALVAGSFSGLWSAWKCLVCRGNQGGGQ